MLNNKLFICITAITLLAGCGEAAVMKADIIDIDSIESKEANYQLYECVPTTVERVASGQANINYPVYMPLSFRESGGRLKKIYVSHGQSVKKGEVIAEITFDDGSLFSDIREKEIGYENALLNSELEMARRMFEIDEMRRIRAQSTDRSENESIIWDLRIRKAESDYDFYMYDNKRRMDKQLKELEELREKIPGEQIVAPYNCVIHSISSYLPGKIIEPGETIAIVYDPDVFELQFSGDASSFRYNMDIEIEVPRLGTFRGLVISDPAVLDTRETQSQFRAVFTDEVANFEEVKNKIISVKGNFTLDGVVAIPNRGLRNEDAKKYVFILEDGIVKKRYVQQGLFTPELTQILSGVKFGDVIVLN